MKRPLTWLLVVGAVVLVAVTFKPSVQNDGVGYFAYLHSIFVDHDLSLANEYQTAEAEGVSLYAPLLEQKTATGLLADYFPIGAAVVASPAYLVTLIVWPSGDPVFLAPFSTVISLVSLFLGLVAIAIGYRLAASVTSSRAALAGAVGAAAAMSFVYYLLYEPSYSHTFSACAVAVFLYLWWRGRDSRTLAGWLVLGLLGGFLGLIRYQDGPLLLIALLDRPRRWWHVAVFFAGATIAFAPQLVVDRTIFGTWLPARPPGQDLQFFPGHYLDVLFSTHYGLFTWTPIALLGVAGFAFVKDRRLQLAFVYAFLVEVVIGGATPDWEGGFAFGARRFISLLPFFVIGLAAITERLPTRATWAGLSLLVAWNLDLIGNLTFINPSGDPGWARLLFGQVKALPYLPHLVSQGAVGRALLFWPFLHLKFDPIYGLAVACGEIACIIAALMAFRALHVPQPRRADVTDIPVPVAPVTEPAVPVA